jgi:hypothetical protein
VKVRHDLPGWLDSMSYSSQFHTITLHVGPTILLEVTPPEARALIAALGDCLTQAERAARVLDVPSPSHR